MLTLHRLAVVWELLKLKMRRAPLSDLEARILLLVEYGAAALGAPLLAASDPVVAVVQLRSEPEISPLYHLLDKDLSRLNLDEWKQLDAYGVHEEIWSLGPEVAAALKAALKEGRRPHAVSLSTDTDTGVLGSVYLPAPSLTPDQLLYWLGLCRALLCGRPLPPGKAAALVKGVCPSCSRT